MANNKIYQVYSELPSWAKGLVVVGGLAIVYFTAKSILKRVQQQASQKTAQETINTQKEEVKVLQEQGMQQTYRDSQYKTWADQIQKQFDGCDGSWGRTLLSFTPPTWLFNTNWSNSGAMVANIFDKLKNDVDYLKLTTSYGIRTYDQCGLMTGDFTGNLQQAIDDELDEQERATLNKFLASKGITYKV